MCLGYVCDDSRVDKETMIFRCGLEMSYFSFIVQKWDRACCHQVRSLEC